MNEEPAGEPKLIERLQWWGEELREGAINALVIFIVGLPFMVILSLGAGR